MPEIPDLDSLDQDSARFMLKLEHSFLGVGPWETYCKNFLVIINSYLFKNFRTEKLLF